MSPALREKRVGRGPHGWTDSNRDKAAAVNSSKVKAHDAEAVPIIRDLRRTWAVVAIDRRLPRPLHGPAGRRGGWTPGGWTHKAVQRIAARHGIQ